MLMFTQATMIVIYVRVH